METAWGSELENTLEKTKSTLHVELEDLENDDVTEEETKRAEVDSASCNPKVPKAHGHMGRLKPTSLNRTENFVRFQSPLAERSDGLSRNCAILFRTSHPAATRFRLKLGLQYTQAVRANWCELARTGAKLCLQFHDGVYDFCTIALARNLSRVF